MKLPSKILPYNKSYISKFPVLISEIKQGPISPMALYTITKKHFHEISEFIETINCLYAIGCISFDVNSRRIYYVI